MKSLWTMQIALVLTCVAFFARPGFSQVAQPPSAGEKGTTPGGGGATRTAVAQNRVPAYQQI